MKITGKRLYNRRLPGYEFEHNRSCKWGNPKTKTKKSWSKRVRTMLKFDLIKELKRL